MNPIENIRKYKRSFSSLALNDQENFKTYLEKNNKSIVEFMLEIGLNKEIIRPFNYNEIESLLRKLLIDEGYPTIDFPPNGSDLSKTSLSLSCSQKKGNVIVSDKSISFNAFSPTSEETKSNEMVNFINYSYENGNLIKSDITAYIEIEYEDIHNINSQFYSGIHIIASESVWNNEDKLLHDYKYEVKINKRLTNMVFSNIFGALSSGNALSALAIIIKLIKSGRLDSRNIEINHNFGDLIKK